QRFFPKAKPPPRVRFSRRRFSPPSNSFPSTSAGSPAPASRCGPHVAARLRPRHRSRFPEDRAGADPFPQQLRVVLEADPVPAIEGPNDQPYFLGELPEMRGGALVRGTPLVAEPDRGLGLAEQLAVGIEHVGRQAVL